MPPQVVPREADVSGTNSFPRRPFQELIRRGPADELIAQEITGSSPHNPCDFISLFLKRVHRYIQM